MDELTPAQLNRWLAQAEVDAWGEEVATAAAQALNRLLVVLSRSIKVEQDDLATAKDMLPKWHFDKQPKPKQEMTTAQITSALEALAGIRITHGRQDC